MKMKNNKELGGSLECKLVANLDGHLDENWLQVWTATWMKIDSELALKHDEIAQESS